MAEDTKSLTGEAEGVISTFRQNLEYAAKDEELILAINKAIAESRELKEVIDRIGRINKLYWRQGTSKDLTRFHPKKAKITSNRIFTDVETAIPILTSEPPEPTIIGVSENDLKNRLQVGLKIAYEVKYKMQQRLQCLIRHWFLSRIGVLKYRWDKEKGFITENVLPRKIGFDKRATSMENCEYFWEELEDNAENLIKKFPKKSKEIIALVGSDRLKTKVKYIEFWGDNASWVCWKVREIILDKKKNPNYDFEIPENNLFKNPHFPYLIMAIFSTGDETGMYDETSLIEEAIPLQEGVNQLEQQILDLNEGQKRVWVASGEAISEQKFQQLVDSTGDIGLYLDRKMPVGGVQQIQSGKPDASLFNHLAHILGEIDNVMGIHSTTRGATSARQETLGAQQLQMGSDYGRLDLIVRNVEQVMEEWYLAYLQCLKIYALESEVLENGETKVELSGQEIPQGIVIMIKKGSTLPTDDKTRFQNAIQLAQFGMIDPATLFEEMQYSDVEKRVQDLYTWLSLTGKIQPQQPEMPATGQPGALQGQEGGEEQKLQQVQRLRDILQTAQGLPPGEQAEVVGQVQQASQTI